MENHHHCLICGNMIRPSLLVCSSCVKSNPNLRRLPGNDKLSVAIREAVERYIEDYSRKVTRN